MIYNDTPSHCLLPLLHSRTVLPITFCKYAKFSLHFDISMNSIFLRFVISLLVWIDIKIVTQKWKKRTFILKTSVVIVINNTGFKINAENIKINANKNNTTTSAEKKREKNCLSLLMSTIAWLVELKYVIWGLERRI